MGLKAVAGITAGGTAANPILFPDGTAAAPSVAWSSDADGTGTGFYRHAANAIGMSMNGVASHYFAPTQHQMVSTAVIEWSSGAIGATVDVTVSKVATNGLRYSGLGNVTTTSRTELNKAVATITNAAATDVLTVTIPNAAHSASLLVRVTGSLGAGGAIGANEATATNSYIIAITRTAGVATVATATAAFGAVAVAVAGAATVTATATVTAMTGAVGATQTFTVQITITRSAGSSDNHTCLVYAQLMNANVTGITIA